MKFVSIFYKQKHIKCGGYIRGAKPPEIFEKMKKAVNFWKGFYFSKFAKARIVEIFISSRLWYAAKFYPIPDDIQNELQQAFRNYINFPAKTPTVTQLELFKLRKHGGLKLIHIDTKSTASKIKWLIEIIINPN